MFALSWKILNWETNRNSITQRSRGDTASFWVDCHCRIPPLYHQSYAIYGPYNMSTVRHRLTGPQYFLHIGLDNSFTTSKSVANVMVITIWRCLNRRCSPVRRGLFTIEWGEVSLRSNPSTISILTRRLHAEIANAEFCIRSRLLFLPVTFLENIYNKRLSEGLLSYCIPGYISLWRLTCTTNLSRIPRNVCTRNFFRIVFGYWFSTRTCLYRPISPV